MPPALLRLLLAGGLPMLAAAAAQADAAADVRALMRQGDLAAALQRAAAADPRDAQARFLRGVILMDQQRDDEAMAQFEAMAQDFPELAEPYNNIALLHARAGRLDAALTALQTALRNQPAHATARLNLAEIHLRLAIRAWEAAASAAPADMALAHRLRLARDLASMPR